MRATDDILFSSKPCKDGYLEDYDYKFHYLNGEAGEHNAFSKLISDEKKRQQGWEKAVFVLRCDEKGNRYYAETSPTEFHKNIDRNIARDMGMIILGIKKGEEQNDFDEEVDAEVKNSKKEKEATTS